MDEGHDAIGALLQEGAPHRAGEALVSEEQPEISPLAQARIDELLARSPALQEAVEQEPRVLSLLQTATLAPAPARWWHYELLKNLGMSLVGWEARTEMLRTSEHYVRFVQALDALLPAPGDDEDEREENA
jgi:hypothetical protein